MSEKKEVPTVETDLDSFLQFRQLLANSGMDYNGVASALRRELGVDLVALDVPDPYHAGIMGVVVDGKMNYGLAFVGADNSNCQIVACAAPTWDEAFSTAMDYALLQALGTSGKNEVST